jgi:co-chaperonin GroES (HSP10)
VGDKVVFSKFAGFGVPGKDGKLYRCVNDRDIFMAVEEAE